MKLYIVLHFDVSKTKYKMEREEDAFLQFVLYREIQEEIIYTLKNDKVIYTRIV